MHFVVIFFIGVVCAWAFKRKNAHTGLGKWRPIAGGIAAALPNIDALPEILGCSVCFQFEYGPLWSILLAPIYALCLAYAFAWYTKIEWKRFFPLILSCWFVGLVLGLFSSQGVMLLWPLPYRFSLNILFPFDLYLLGASILTISIYLTVKKWPRDIARVGLLVMIIYVIAVCTFHYKAQKFAESYASITGVEVSEINVSPQPISPFNWRIIITTEDGRLHDTRVSLFYNEEQDFGDDARRSARIQALYKPLDKAVWRIYRRFGNRNSKGVEAVWNEQIQNPAFKWFSRYAVYQGLVEYDGKACTRFKDLRYLAARNDEAGYVLVCAGQNGETYTYKAGRYGRYGRIL